MATLKQQIETLPDNLRWQGKNYRLGAHVPIKGGGIRIVFLSEDNQNIYMRFLFEGNELIDWEKVEKDNGDLPSHLIPKVKPIKLPRIPSTKSSAAYQRAWRKLNPERDKANAKRAYENRKKRKLQNADYEEIGD